MWHNPSIKNTWWSIKSVDLFLLWLLRASVPCLRVDGKSCINLEEKMYLVPMRRCFTLYFAVSTKPFITSILKSDKCYAMFNYVSRLLPNYSGKVMFPVVSIQGVPYHMMHGGGVPTPWSIRSWSIAYAEGGGPPPNMLKHVQSLGPTPSPIIDHMHTDWMQIVKVTDFELCMLRNSWTSHKTGS